MVAELGCQFRLPAWTLALICEQNSSLCAVNVRLPSAMDDSALRMVGVANRIRMLETNFVTVRTARLDAEKHVQTLTAQLQTLTRNPTNQAEAQLTGLMGTKVWEKRGKLDASVKGGWNDWKPVT